MSILNTDFYISSDDSLYTDGVIEDEIYKKICNKDMSIYEDRRWEMFYHFSPLRENILNWYNFDKNSTVLEVGGGCGALTGLLTRRCKSVVSCELTLKRAKIINKRYEDVNNLEVVVGNFMRINFEKKFDYIIVNGVLEYAELITGTNNNAFKKFLEYLKILLNNNGKVLIAIENKFGLKYFNGAPEDHTGIIFDGLNDYSNGSKVKTFTKLELQNLCTSANLPIIKWYYPYPDYKFTTEIFTDDSINQIIPLTKDIPFDQDRIELYNKHIVYKNLMNNNIMDYFSNSFLLELGNNIDITDRPSYIKINNNRNKSFALYTMIFQHQNKVIKKSLYKDGEEHIKQMYELGKNDINVIETEYDSGLITYPLINHCETLHDKLVKYFSENNEDKFWNELAKIKKMYCISDKSSYKDEDDFRLVFGDAITDSMLHWQKNINIDLTIDNIFFKDSKIVIIDNEWVFKFYVPVEYSLWRMLMHLKESEPNISWININTIMNFLQINQKDVSTFRLWEKHFAIKYVGIKDFSYIQKGVYNINLNKILAEQQKNIISSNLFLFFDDNTYEIIASYASIKDDVWTVSFYSENISKAKSIRWDPLEGNACKIYDVKTKEFLINAVNAYSENNNEYVFTTYDPQFNLKGVFDSTNAIEIKFRCEILDWTFGYYHLEQENNKLMQENNQLIYDKNQLLEKKYQLEKEIYNLEQAQYQLEQARNYLNERLNEVLKNPIKYTIKAILNKRKK